jgi:hypothetical protein
MPRLERLRNTTPVGFHAVTRRKFAFACRIKRAPTTKSWSRCYLPSTTWLHRTSVTGISSPRTFFMNLWGRANTAWHSTPLTKLRRFASKHSTLLVFFLQCKEETLRRRKLENRMNETEFHLRGNPKVLRWRPLNRPPFRSAPPSHKGPTERAAECPFTESESKAVRSGYESASLLWQLEKGIHCTSFTPSTPTGFCRAAAFFLSRACGRDK